MGTGKNLKEERLGAIGYNKQGDLMKIVEYNDADDITVEFQDEHKCVVHTAWHHFQKGLVKNSYELNNRLGRTKYNTQGYLMKVVEYNNANNIIVEFQDQYKCRIKTGWHHFLSGKVYNYYHPNKYGGIVGNKYPISINRKHTKEYVVWMSMLNRCFGIKMKQSRPTYKDVTCCKEWLFFENFYEWLHKQENFKVWLKTDKFCLDKDILVKGNKVYGPDTCCLVPDYVNTLFTTSGGKRGQLPIGVAYRKDCVDNPYRPQKSLGMQKNYATPEEAFLAYKEWKEAYIKQVAQEEYDKGTISKKCYEAMMKWEVEIGD